MRKDEHETIYDPPNAEARGKMRQRKLPPKQQENGRDQTDDLDLGELDAGLDTAPIPPRGWLLGNSFCRGFVASLFGEGAVGKTALRMAQLLSLATQRSLTGEHVFVRARLLIVSLEDNLDELRRRLRAICLHYYIEPHEYAGWLFFAAPGRKGGKLLTTDAQNRPVAGQLAAKIIHTIKKRKIDIVCIDPFVKSHSVEENNNRMIDEVVQALTDIAMEHNICIDSPHHVSKGQGDPGNANRGRGASSLKDGARLVTTLTVMNAEEAKTLGVSEADRRSLVRLDSGKVNIAPPLEQAKWFRLVGVSLGNGNKTYPNGDEVQTVEAWIPPPLFKDITTLAINQILNDIDTGLTDGNRYTEGPNVGARAAWQVVKKHCPEKNEEQCRRIIGVWVKSGLLIKGDYDNLQTRKPAKGLWIDNSKRPL